MSRKSTKRGAGSGPDSGSKAPAKSAAPAWTPSPPQAVGSGTHVPGTTSAAPVPVARTPMPVPAAPPPAVASPAARAAKPTHEEISRLAHDLWAQRGKPQGQDIAIWCEAERRLTKKT